MTNLIDAALSRTRTILSLLVLILVSGAVAYATIPREANPDIDIPWAGVMVTHEGISPEDGERLLARPLERELRTIEGVREIKTTAGEGYAMVSVHFEANIASDQAMQDVREKVDMAKSELPSDTDEPRVLQNNPSLEPIILITLSGEVPDRLLYKLGRRLKTRLEQVPDVLSIEDRGLREDLLEVIVDPSRLESYNISPAQLFRAVSFNNRLIAAGMLDTGQWRFAVKVPGLLETAKDVFELPVKVEGDAVVTLGDITSVRRTYKDAVSVARLNGEPAILLMVTKRIGANIVDTVAKVREIVAEEQQAWPPNVKLNYSWDGAEEIQSLLKRLQNAVLTAVLLVMIVVVAALGLRSGLLVGVAIPGSFLFAFMVLGFMGYSVNQIVLFGMILAVGMLVDGSIVITEYADRKMAEGIDRSQAYSIAAQRMVWPVTASIATTIVAFMPLIFWPGMMGRFLSQLPLTVIFVLFGSLLMAMLFVPALGSIFGRTEANHPETLKALRAAEHGDLRALPGFTGWYTRFLDRMLQHPLRVLVAATVMLIAVFGTYATVNSGVTLLGDSEHGFIKLVVHARGNLSMEEKRKYVEEVEARILHLDGLKNLSVFVRPARLQYGEAEDSIGMMYVYFKDWDERRPEKDLIEDIRQRTENVPGIQVELDIPRNINFGGKDIAIELSSNNGPAIESAVTKLRSHLESMEGLVDVDDSRPLPGLEWKLSVDRALAGKYGADMSTVGGVVQLVTNGIKVGDYRPDDADDEVDIRVRFPVGERSIAQLDQLKIPTDSGQVPISNFVKREPKLTTGVIRKVDGRRIILVQSSVDQGVVASTKVALIREWLKTANIDPSVRVIFKGQEREQSETSAFLFQAFAIALFLMAVILVTQFNRFYHAFLILSAVILSTVGVFLGLLITGMPFSSISNGLGIVALAGIVVNNNIVLIDTFSRLKKGGMETYEAIMRTGAQRLRPVLLTTITTIAGLLPMALMVNIDFITREVEIGAPELKFWVPLASTIIFGLSFATVLTLIVTPCALVAPTAVKDLWAHRGKYWGRARQSRATN